MSDSPLLSCFVGRERELEQLWRWYEKAFLGERQVVFVTGEPGMGKTTLIEAFRQRLEAGGWRLAPSPQASSLKPLASPVRLGRGQCIEQYGAGKAYLPILEALGQLGRTPRGIGSAPCCVGRLQVGWCNSQVFAVRQSSMISSAKCRE